MKRIALVGSTGGVGSRIAREASARGHHVLEVLPADVDLFGSLAVATGLRGNGVLVSAYGAPAAEPHNLPQATRSLLHSAEAAGLERVLTVGGCAVLVVPEMGRLAATDGFPAALHPKVRALHEALVLLAASRMVQTCLSPPEQIGPGERIGRYRLTAAALARDAAARSTISDEDFACAVVDELEAGRHPGQLLGTGY